MDWLFEQFGEWVSGYYLKQVQQFADDVIDLVLDVVDGFWQNNLLDGFLDFAAVISGIVLGVSILIAIFDIVEENKTIIWKQIFMNLFKGGLFTIFARHIGLMCLTITNLIVRNLKLDFDRNALWAATSATTISEGVTSLLWVLILIIVFIAFGVVCVMRNASMFVLMMSSFLYIPDIVRGDTAKMGDWIRQVVAVSLTFMFQYILFCLGINGVLSMDVVTALTGFAGIFVVPKLLQKFGYSSGVTGIMSGAGNMAMQAKQLLVK